MRRLRAVAWHSWSTSSDAGRHTSRPRPRVAAGALLALAVATITACSSAVTSSTSSPSTAPSTSAPPASSSASASSTTEVGLSAVPSGAQADYAHYELYSKLYPNAYQNFTPPTGKVQ